MKFKTAITSIDKGGEIIRGYKLTALAQEKSFSDTIWLLLRGEFPTLAEAKMFGAILTMAIDHGPGTASAQAARISASVKTSLQASVSAGLLAMGDRHGGAVDLAAKFFEENNDTQNLTGLLEELKIKKIRVPGYGHAVLAKDSRTETLFEIAKETGFYQKYCHFAEQVEKELNKTASKPLPLNIDGSLAAILLEMGFASGTLMGIFIIARVPGLVAQITEEITDNAGLRRPPEDEIDYVGPSLREIGV